MRSDREIRVRVEKRRKNNTVEGEVLRPQLGYTPRRNHHLKP